MDEISLAAYWEILEQEDDQRAVQAAIATLAERRRGEGETGWPEIGYLLEEIENAREKFRSKSDPPFDIKPVYRPRALRIV